MEHLDTMAERESGLVFLCFLVWEDLASARLVLVCMLQRNKQSFKTQIRKGLSVFNKTHSVSSPRPERQILKSEEADNPLRVPADRRSSGGQLRARLTRWPRCHTSEGIARAGGGPVRCGAR